MAVVRSKKQSRVTGWARYSALALGAVLFLIPFYLLLRSAFMREQDLGSPDFHWLPPQWETSNLTGLFDNPAIPMARSLLNSGVIAVTQTVGVLVVSGLAGYGLARIPYRWSNTVFYFITATLLIPAAVTFVPSFVLVSTLGWISTLRGLIIPGLFQALATFLFRQFFLGFPKEIEEAAFIDGLGYWGTFWRIVVPNSFGFVAAIGTITFIGSWNAFLWPLVIGRDQESWTVQIALSTFKSAFQFNTTGTLAGATLVMMVPIVAFLLLQRQVVHGLTAGSSK